APPTLLLPTLSLHDALPTSPPLTRPPPWGRRTRRSRLRSPRCSPPCRSQRSPAPPPRPAALARTHRRPRPTQQEPPPARGSAPRSEEHTSELQSPYDLVCRL